MASAGILVGAVMVAIPVTLWWNDDDTEDAARASGRTLAVDATGLAAR